MKINKVFEILFVVFLIMSMVSAGSAAVVNHNAIMSPTTSATTTVSYGASLSYNITLPQSVTFTSVEKSMSTTIKAEDVILEPGKSLLITVQSKHDWKMFNHTGNVIGTSFIPYTMSFDGNTLAGDPDDTSGDLSDIAEVLVVPTGQEKEVVVTFAFTEVPHTGDYKDTLTFTIDPAYTPTP